MVSYMQAKPVVALDIDGTLGDYHAHFLQFAQEWYGRDMPAADTINPGLPLHKFMRTSKTTYRQCKLAYRQGGLERSMPVYSGARELCSELRRAGAEVWLCTTRPYLKHDTQSPNTIHWLKRNGIQWDHMISGPHKYVDLARQVGADRVVAVLDDLPPMVYQAHDLGMGGVCLRDQPYNVELERRWFRIYDLHAARHIFLHQVKQYKEKHNAG